MLRMIKSYMTLKFVEFKFTDAVTLKPVYLYVDCYGDKWMKTSRFALFRVKSVITPKHTL